MTDFYFILKVPDTNKLDRKEYDVNMWIRHNYFRIGSNRLFDHRDGPSVSI